MSKERPSVNPRLLYHRYVNKLEQEVNVTVGFGLFLGSVVLAVLALVLMVWSFSLEGQSDAYYTWIEPGYAMALLSLPLFMLGIVVLLPPPDRKFLGLALSGVVVAMAATGGFLWAYPGDWYHHGANYTLEVVLIYAVGLAAISVGTGASLREHASELIETVTRISQPDPDESAADAGSDAPADDVADADTSVSLGSSADRSTDVASGATSVNADDDADSRGGSAVRSISVESVGGDKEGIVALVINGEEYVFGDGDTFGRREEPWLEDLKMACDGHEEIPYVSSEHLEFTVEDGDVYVEDLSRNGTKLNGRDLDGGRAKLSDGDTLVLADRAKLGVKL